MKGYIQHSTRQEIRRLKEILTFEQYEKIVQRVIDIAINGEKDRDALQAAMYIIDRMEGKIPLEVTTTLNGSQTINDLLRSVHEEPTTTST